MNKNRIALYSMILLGAFFAAFLSKLIFFPNPNDSTTITNIHSLLELLAFASNILLFVVAIFGLQQLYYAQKDIETTQRIFRTQSRRNSFESAADQCKNFSETLIPLSNQLDKFIADNKITFFEDAEMKETEDGFSVDLSKVAPEQAAKFSEIEELITKYINGMELFALYFVSRIADENIAFLTVGDMYVREVERLAMILPITNGTQDDCKAIWPLYFSWKTRLNKQQLESEKSKIEKKLKRLNVETEKSLGKPIGTE